MRKHLTTIAVSLGLLLTAPLTRPAGAAEFTEEEIRNVQYHGKGYHLEPFGGVQNKPDAPENRAAAIAYLRHWKNWNQRNGPRRVEGPYDLGPVKIPGTVTRASYTNVMNGGQPVTDPRTPPQRAWVRGARPRPVVMGSHPRSTWRYSTPAVPASAGRRR